MKSFLSDRPRVSTPTLQVASPGGVTAFAPAAIPGPRHAHGSAGAAGNASGGGGAGASGTGAGGSRVECVREGDRITRVIVTCACGERIEIDCLYGAGA